MHENPRQLSWEGHICSKDEFIHDKYAGTDKNFHFDFPETFNTKIDIGISSTNDPRDAIGETRCAACASAQRTQSPIYRCQ